MGLGCRFCHAKKGLKNLLNQQRYWALGLQEEKGNKFYVLHEDTWEPLRWTDWRSLIISLPCPCRATWASPPVVVQLIRVWPWLYCMGFAQGQMKQPCNKLVGHASKEGRFHYKSKQVYMQYKHVKKSLGIWVGIYYLGRSIRLQ
jgi:hypothetical protein